MASRHFWSARFRKALGLWLVRFHSEGERLANRPRVGRSQLYQRLLASSCMRSSCWGIRGLTSSL
ncbi:hypothetical protein D3C75_1069240 [compost metagenome]